MVAEHGDDGDADLGQLGGEDLGLGGFAGAGEIAGQEEDIRLIAQPGQERRERSGGLGPGMDIGDGGNTDHAGILPRVEGVEGVKGVPLRSGGEGAAGGDARRVG